MKIDRELDELREALEQCRYPEPPRQRVIDAIEWAIDRIENLEACVEAHKQHIAEIDKAMEYSSPRIIEWRGFSVEDWRREFNLLWRNASLDAVKVAFLKREIEQLRSDLTREIDRTWVS